MILVIQTPMHEALGTMSVLWDNGVLEPAELAALQALGGQFASWCQQVYQRLSRRIQLPLGPGELSSIPIQRLNGQLGEGNS